MTKANEFAADGAKMIGPVDATVALPKGSGARPEDLKKMFMNEIMADFENNMTEALRPGCGMPLAKMHEVFGKELAAMLPNALAAKSPSPEQMFVIEQAYLKLHEHNKGAKPQTNVFADLVKSAEPQTKVDFMAKLREQYVKGM